VKPAVLLATVAVPVVQIVALGTGSAYEVQHPASHVRRVDFQTVGGQWIAQIAESAGTATSKVYKNVLSVRWAALQIFVVEPGAKIAFLVSLQAAVVHPIVWLANAAGMPMPVAYPLVRIVRVAAL